MGSLAALALGGWLVYGFWPHAERASAAAQAAEGDLEWLAAARREGAPAEAARDLLATDSDRLYLVKANDHTIVAQPKDGGPGRTLARTQGSAWGLAVAGGFLWLTTTGADDAGSGGAVLRVPVSGGEPVVVSGGLAKPRAIASDARWAFVVDTASKSLGLLRGSTIVRVGGGQSPLVLGSSEGEVVNISLDDARVYWADRLQGTIVTVPKAGGEPRVLAAERGLPGEVVVAGDSLFWVEKRSESLWTMPKAGGAPREVARDFAGFAHLTVDARGIWWVNESAVEGSFRVLTVPRAGGDPVPFGPSVEAIDALVSDGANLFWSRGGEVAKLAPRP